MVSSSRRLGSTPSDSRIVQRGLSPSAARGFVPSARARVRAREGGGFFFFADGPAEDDVRLGVVVVVDDRRGYLARANRRARVRLFPSTRGSVSREVRGVEALVSVLGDLRRARVRGRVPTPLETSEPAPLAMSREVSLPARRVAVRHSVAHRTPEERRGGRALRLRLEARGASHGDPHPARASRK